MGPWVGAVQQREGKLLIFVSTQYFYLFRASQLLDPFRYCGLTHGGRTARGEGGVYSSIA